MQVAELQVGAGYLAQSTATLFFTVPADGESELSVRWPDGLVTQHTVMAGGGVLLVSHP